MARQATLTDDTNSPVDEVLGGINDLGTNVLTLGTLQARLAAADLRESMWRGLPAWVALAAVLPLAIASTTIGLLGIAWWIAVDRPMPFSLALLLVAAAGAVVSALLAAFAAYRLRTSFQTFRRSREELERNIAWLGTVFSHSGR